MIFFTRNVLGLITAISVVALLSACGEEPTQNDAQQSKPKPAKMLTLKAAKESKLLSFPAVIDSHNLTTLAFEVGGRLSELLVVEAQDVKSGEILARLDQQDLTTKLKSAQAQYNNTHKEYKRAQRLIKADAISRSELDLRKSKNDIDQASLLSAKKALADSVLKAPFDGNIAKVSVTTQQVLQAGEPAIVILGSGGLEAKFNLPTRIIARANNNDKSNLDAYITLDSAPSLKIPAQFKQVTLTADASSQTHEVTFAFVAPEHINVLPGMNALAWFTPPESDTTVTGIQVPLAAIASANNIKFVWVVDPTTMQVSKRVIVIADSIGESITVTDGLSSGEKIVVAGISYLSEGMLVRPWLPQP